MNERVCMDLTFVVLLSSDRAPAVVDVELSWDPTDPPVITMVVDPGRRGKAVTWELSRDLLSDGVHWGPVGMGDVSVLPYLHNDGQVELVLDTPSGRAALLLDRNDVGMFLLAVARRAAAAGLAEVDPGAGA